MGMIVDLDILKNKVEIWRNRTIKSKSAMDRIGVRAVKKLVVGDLEAIERVRKIAFAFDFDEYQNKIARR